MGGYYPEGVSGREYQIAGPQAEWSDIRTVSCGNSDCAMFDVEHDVELDLEAYDWQEWGTWRCDECGEWQDYAGTMYPYEGDDRIGEY